MSAPDVSIVIPTYKEAQNLAVLVPRLGDALARAAISAEIIIVDDDSRDGTETVIAELARQWPVRLITRTNERGLSSAVVRGFDEAKADVLLCMDADLSHPPESAADLIAAVRRDEADFCIGSRYTRGGRTKDDWGLLRWINSKVATALARPLTSATDPMAGFFCLPRATLERARSAGISPIGYKIGLEIMIKARCRRVAEVPIVFSDRLHGTSKLTVRQQVEYLYHLYRLYRFRYPFGSVALPGGIAFLVVAIGARLAGVW